MFRQLKELLEIILLGFGGQNEIHWGLGSQLAVFDPL